MKSLYYVRHGQSEMNVAHLLSGTTNTPLTEKGREQAQSAIAAAKNLSIDLIVTSPLSRAYDTAKIIAEGINYPIEDIQILDILLERTLGELEGAPWSEKGIAGDIQGVKGAETNEQLLARAAKFYQEIQQNPADTILIAGHGAFSHALRQIVNPSESHWDEPWPPNGEIFRLV